LVHIAGLATIKDLALSWASRAPEDSAQFGTLCCWCHHESLDFPICTVKG
jgi:hypothetical protein